MPLHFNIFILIILVYSFRFGESAQQNQQSSLISKYYHNIQKKFFVLIGAQENFSPAISSQLRSWSGLNIVQNMDQIINNQRHQSKYQTLNFVISSSKNSEQDKLNTLSLPQITLRQICQSYYLAQPSLMIITQPTKQYLILSTNEWNKEICSPQMIFVANNSNLEDANLQQYLAKNDYRKLESTSRFTSYIKNNHFEKVHNRGIKYQQNKPKTLYFNQKNSISALYRTLLLSQFYNQQQMHNPTQIYVAQMTGNLLILPNILKQSMFFVKKRPIFIFNFRIGEDAIFISGQNYSVTLLIIQDMMFKNIAISLQDNIFNVYILINAPNKDQRLKIINQNGQFIFQNSTNSNNNSQIKPQCTLFHEKVLVNIRNNQYPYQPLKANIAQQIKHPKIRKTHKVAPKSLIASAQISQTKVPQISVPINVAWLQSPKQQFYNVQSKIEDKIQNILPVPNTALNPPQKYINQNPKIQESNYSQISNWIIIFCLIALIFLITLLIILIIKRINIQKIETKPANVSKIFSYFQQPIETFQIQQIQQSQQQIQRPIQNQQQM